MPVAILGCAITSSPSGLSLHGCETRSIDRGKVATASPVFHPSLTRGTENETVTGQLTHSNRGAGHVLTRGWRTLV